MFYKKSLYLLFAACFLFTGLFFVLTSSSSLGEDNDDPLSFQFRETGEEELETVRPTYVDYHFQGLEDYDMQAEVRVKNNGEEDQSFTLFEYDEKNDLSPNPNTNTTTKIDVFFQGLQNQEIGAGKEMVLEIPFELSDDLLSLEDPYVLTLNFRNEDTKNEVDLEIRMNILPVYELRLSDGDGSGRKDMERKVLPGARLDFALHLENHGNALDIARIVVESDHVGVTVTLKKPVDGLVEGVKPKLLDQNAVQSIAITVETREELENAKYYVTVTVSSEFAPHIRDSMQYTIELGDVDPTKPPGPDVDEKNLPAWVVAILLLLPFMCLVSGSAFLLRNGNGNDEDEDEDLEGNQGEHESKWVEQKGQVGGELQSDSDHQNSFRESPRPPAAPASRKVQCPGCQGRFRLKNPKRPLKIRCPHCFKPMVIRAKSEAKKMRSLGSRAQTLAVGCPQCKARFRVKNPGRALKLKCPGCGKPVLLKETASSGNQASKTDTKAPKSIKCPACTTCFKVRNQKRPLKLKCPGCARIMTLK